MNDKSNEAAESKSSTTIQNRESEITALIVCLAGFQDLLLAGTIYKAVIIFHCLVSILIFTLGTLTKQKRNYQKTAILITLAVYSPALTYISSYHFTFSTMISCIILLFCLIVDADNTQIISFSLISICGWKLCFQMYNKFDSQTIEILKPHWNQFLVVYFICLLYTISKMLFKDVNHEKAIQKPATTQISNQTDPPHVNSPTTGIKLSDHQDLLEEFVKRRSIPVRKSMILEHIESKSRGLADSLQQKENFILKFSHEIRNPLNSLLGNIDLALEGIKDQYAKELIEDAKVSGEILLQLLNNILDSNKIASGKLEVSYISCDIREYIEKMWPIIGDIIRKRKLYGSVYVSSNMPTYITMDPHRTTQVIMNLTTNAAKFTENGSIKWYIDYIPGEKSLDEAIKPKHTNLNDLLEDSDDEMDDIDEKNPVNYDVLDTKRKRLRDKDKDVTKSSEIEDQSQKGYLRLEIVDTGCGMTQASLAGLFQKFEQVSEETSKRQIGTGLGLWITKEIAELMNGRVQAFSKKNVGTCFVALLETERVAKNVSMSKMPTFQKLPTVVSKKALIVENDPSNQDIIKKYFNKYKIQEVSIANNGQEGLEIFKNKGRGYFELITMNLDMPVMNGMTAIKLIREHEVLKGWEPSRIVIISAFDDDETKKSCLSESNPYKVDAFLVKPVNIEQIGKVLSDINKKKLQNHAILVAEDDFFNLNLLGNFFEKMGVKCIKSRNGEEAIRLYNQNKHIIGLVLMDCEMPVMDGFTATKTIIELSAQALGKSIPIYGLTGHTEEIYRERCRQAGMRDMLTKPIDFSSLKSLVNRELTQNNTE